VVERWPAELLSQVGRPFANHPAVISAEMCSHIGKHVQFQHVFRHACAVDPKREKMAELILCSGQVTE